MNKERTYSVRMQVDVTIESNLDAEGAAETAEMVVAEAIGKHWFEPDSVMVLSVEVAE